MNILGVSCFYHDAAAALLQDGVLTAAVEEERFSRKKHDSSFPLQSIRFCCRRGNLRPSELDYVVFYEKPFRKFHRLFFSILSAYPRSAALFRDSMQAWLSEKLWIKELIREKTGLSPEKILFSEHHLSHAASAFFCSPYEEAAILTVDGVGEWTTASLGRGRAVWPGGSGRNEIRLESELRFPHSLGLLYSAFTAFLGFEVNEGEYKVMGLAPYGTPRYLDRIEKVVRVHEDGGLDLDLSYFSHHYHRSRSFTERFVRLFGAPRDPDARFVTRQCLPPGHSLPPSAGELERNQYYADIAASIQKTTEEILLRMARHLQAKTGLKKLCLAGGVALNSVANHRILRETPFEEIYIQPAAGDSGGALGAALACHHLMLQKPRAFVMEHAFWGRDYGRAGAADCLRENGVAHEIFEDEEKLAERIVEALAAGKVAGYFQGGWEWGPRALGHRSILADPRRPEMRDIVNTKVKFREPFRPFAPSVPEESCERYFDLPEARRHYPARFMLYVAPVREAFRSRLPAVTHVDGTARLQTVEQGRDGRYCRLIRKFGELTGLPVLLNTSFNLKGEPIVASPDDALRTFQNSGLDLLVLENALVCKKS